MIKREAINIQSNDYTQMFDSMQLRKCMVSLINGGLSNEEAEVVYNLNKEIYMAVKNNNDISRVTKIVDPNGRGVSLQV